MTDLYALHPHLGPQDAPTVERLMTCYRLLEQLGTPNTREEVDRFLKLATLAIRYEVELGLTPMSRRRLPPPQRDDAELLLQQMRA